MHGPFDSETLYRAHELARRRAGQLRDEAIGDVWRGADAVLRLGVDRSGRAARRLVQRLRQHAAARSAGAAADA